VLGGCQDPRLLEVRVFDEAVKRAVYAAQTQHAQAAGVSNCPLCAVGHDANRSRIYEYKEMEADHVTAWSKGGASTPENCQMLCKTHNRAKGNK
jgi:5-methylcytosine-specific restriction endonuclease McrA